ncbi:uncharacterized protein FFNC_15727 [Fusarium fujikuroi]|nr:uncharacterized protein FFNC_15727 [Fusarium fujikuroi]
MPFSAAQSTQHQVAVAARNRQINNFHGH